MMVPTAAMSCLLAGQMPWPEDNTSHFHAIQIKKIYSKLYKILIEIYFFGEYFYDICMMNYEYITLTIVKS